MKTLPRISLLITLVSVAAVGLAACSDAGDEGDVDSDPNGVTSAAIGAQERYIVTFANFGARAAALNAAGATVAREFPADGVVAAYLPVAALTGLQQNPNVIDVELDPRRELFSQTTPYGISMVGATDPAFGGADGAVKVCIIDSGLYTAHEDLAGLAVTGESGTTWNADGCGHGTHVAGTIAAAGNSLGVVGVAPSSVALHIVRVFGNDCAWAYSSDLVAALNECMQAGAKVISMSLGGTFKSNFENSAFQSAYDAGVLSIAAAGNDGNTRISYPAGYASVVSVAAIDSNKAVADFSQKNSDVEIAAPGVGVLSTVPWLATNTLAAGGVTYQGSHIEFAALGAATGALVNGGLCTAAGAWAGKVVLCERGTNSFYEKVTSVKNGGGAAAVIYNNVAGGFAGTLGEGYSSTIPAIGLTQEDGQYLIASNLGSSGTATSTLIQPGSGYEAWDGTSMATPHVSGVAALIWSFNPAWTNVQIRNALTQTAEDLGAVGRDTSYGYGLVRAKAALDILGGGGGCSPSGATETSCSDGVDNDCDGAVDAADADCSTCSALGSSCTSAAQCCSGTCGGKPGAKICK